METGSFCDAYRRMRLLAVSQLKWTALRRGHLGWVSLFWGIKFPTHLVIAADRQKLRIGRLPLVGGGWATEPSLDGRRELNALFGELFFRELWRRVGSRSLEEFAIRWMLGT